MPFFMMRKSLLLITGHSQGLGKAILDEYLSDKCFEVVAISRKSLGYKLPNLTEIRLDLGDLDSLEAKLVDVFPPGNFKEVVLINNAGWIGEIKPVGGLRPDDLQKQVKLNLLAPMYLMNAFVKAYKGMPGSKIVCNISSGAAARPVPGWSGYCSTKAALAMFTKVAAEEHRTSGIHFYSLAPGVVDTPMQADIRKSDEADFPQLQKFIGLKASGDLASPQEVALKIRYLLSNPDLFPEVVQDVRNFEVS